jgi:hypothetical protein
MNNEKDEILKQIAAELDISDSLYEQVVARYEALGKWLCRPESTVRRFDPEIYPQGSIELGTVVKPINDEDEYDIDLVCELIKLSKQMATQQQLKEWVGFEIKGYAVKNNMNSKATEGRRCWTLHYADSAKFHMDTLPSLPDGLTLVKSLEVKGISNPWVSQAIVITDNKSLTYKQITQDWPQSNPKGYVLWFRSRMPKSLFEAQKAKIGRVAQYKTKSPLQQSIQILKRHRDIMFAGDLDDKPISIILTTLAAHAYNGELSVSDALFRIVNNMEYFMGIQNGGAYIPNPSNPNENFADKWRDYPRRKEKFKEWLQQAKTDFVSILQYQNTIEFVEALIPLLGERTVNRASSQVFEKVDTRSLSTQKSLAVSPQFFNVVHRQSPRWVESISGHVTVDCVRSRKGFRSTALKSGMPVSKHWSLLFEAKTNIPHPYQVFWQVVNTGSEARAANQLRGGFYDGATFKKGVRQWRESTLYLGQHWIECFIMKNNLVVARSGPFVVNIT